MCLPIPLPRDNQNKLTEKSDISLQTHLDLRSSYQYNSFGSIYQKKRYATILLVLDLFEHSLI